MARFFTRFGTLLLFSACATTFVMADDWPGWRGPAGNGHSKETNLPTKWDAKSVLWKKALPGEGQSSPVIVGDRIFLTTALENGKKRVVLCVDRKSGNILWQREAWAGVPEKSHDMNGWASATCACDGERVIAFFGKGGLHCYSVDGEKLWSRDLGPFTGPWGTSACPLIVGDLVVQNCDATTNAFLLAVNKKTGKDVWKTSRPDLPKGGWSSPVLIDAGTRKEIVLNGETHVVGYEPDTGEVLWKCKAFNGRGEPTVTPGNGLVYVINGLPGDIYAVKTGGTGDVTASNIVWHTPRKGGRDQPSPIVVGNYLLAADMEGVLTCYDSGSGKSLWKERLRDAKFTASPIAANGLAYFLSEAGETFVIEPGPALKLVAENSVGGKKTDFFRASPTPSGGQIFLRSRSHLYCIGNGKS
jgi:outer membrane protein assembly factor BamB